VVGGLQVDVVDMLRQLAAERVAAKKRVSEVNSPDHASYPRDTASESTAASSVSDGASLPRSGASEGSGTSGPKPKQGALLLAVLLHSCKYGRHTW
jgi:hypothetical protein